VSSGSVSVLRKVERRIEVRFPVFTHLWTTCGAQATILPTTTGQNSCSIIIINN